jgi:DNA modification methylase
MEVINVHTTGNQIVNVVRDDIEPGSPEFYALGIEDNEIGKLSYAPDVDQLAALAAADDAVLAQLRNEDKIFGGMLEGMGIKNETVDAEPQIDRAAELQDKWQTAIGQLWKLGNHRLLIGDCTVRENVERLMGGERASLAPVDPPYNVGFEYDGETVDDTKTEEKYKEFCSAWFGECQRISEKQIVTPGCYNLASWMRWFDAYHWTPWVKTNAMTNGKVSRFLCWEPMLFFGKTWKRSRSNDIFDFPVQPQKMSNNGETLSGLHPCPKPLGMWEDLIENYSELNDIIYECFGGSGTTLMACVNKSRLCRIMEISPAYGAVILERFYTATGITPELVE